VDLSGEELAARSGVSAEEIDRLRRVGILVPAGENGTFSAGDVHRVRVVTACERSGLPAARIVDAIGAGHLSLSFLDSQFVFAESASGDTFAEGHARHGIDPELASAAFEAAGFAAPDPDTRMTQDDEAILTALAMAMRIGVEPVGLQAITRVYGESMRRIAEMNAGLYHQHVELPLLASGMAEAQMRELAVSASAEIVPVTDRMLLAIYRRHDERAITQHIVEHIESALLEAGLIEPRSASTAMCFLDLSGYTQLTEELGDQAAAELAGRLAQVAQAVSAKHRGHPIKWLGDGVMLRFDHPEGAVVAALDMVDEGPTLGLPAAHAGLSSGPVVQQAGDVFGRTVNLASRIAGHAGPGQVLVSQDVVDAVEGGALTFRPIGPVELKGYAAPVSLYRAMRVG
jgi:adenylate cyclase